MHQPNHEKKNEYLGYLDGVRGLAALWVMLFHYFNQRFFEHSMAKLLSFFINGETAIFLFVLSGFVLSYKYIVLNQPLDIKKFYVQRFLRFWIPYFFAVLINALYQYRHDLSLHNLVQQFVFDKGKFWEEASLLRYSPGFSHTPQYYMPGWALVVILSLSFFVPFMIALAQRDKRYVWWMIACFLLIGNNLGDKYIYHVHFALGVLISCYYVNISNGGLRGTKFQQYKYVWLAAAIALFSLRQLSRINKIDFFGTGYDYWVQKFMGINFSLYSAFASFIFLVIIIHSNRIKPWLNIPPLRYLGKISYSLYLMHWVVVVAIYDHWVQIAHWMPNVITRVIVMMVCCTAVSILLASLLYYWVELPAIRFSKRVVKNFKPSLVIDPIVNNR